MGQQACAEDYYIESVQRFGLNRDYVRNSNTHFEFTDILNNITDYRFVRLLARDVGINLESGSKH